MKRDHRTKQRKYRSFDRLRCSCVAVFHVADGSFFIMRNRALPTLLSLSSLILSPRLWNYINSAAISNDSSVSPDRELGCSLFPFSSRTYFLLLLAVVNQSTTLYTDEIYVFQKKNYTSLGAWACPSVECACLGVLVPACTVCRRRGSSSSSSVGALAVLILPGVSIMT